ncbi:MAG: BPL-N domain-containing protein [Candidatus Heimdallarchaeaceae archaeon]
MNQKIFLKSLFLLFLSFGLLPINAKAIVPAEDFDYSLNHLVGVKIAVYNSSGAWQSSVICIQNMLEWAGCISVNVSGQDIIDGCLDDFDILLWPGGGYVSYWGEMGFEGKAAVQEFISNGGSYLGICAGAYYACDYMIWMDDGSFPPPDYKVEGDELNLDLFEGVAWGPIFELAERPDPSYAMVQVNLNREHVITKDLPDTIIILYYGGPYMVPYEDTDSDITILGTYDLTGQNAVVSTTYGDGRVFLISPHGELEEDSNRDGFEPYPDIYDEGSDWPLYYKAIEWLAFKTVEDVTGTPYPFIPISIVSAVIALLLWKKKDK